MDSYHISGGTPLLGEVSLSGAKNGALPILAAAIMTGGVCTVSNCPELSDIHIMTEVLKGLGCGVKREGDAVTIDSRDLSCASIPMHLAKEMRSSIFFMGPLLTRCKEVILSHPGGCAIGARPIDLHLFALRALGAQIEERDGFLYCKAEKLLGTTVKLPFPSVGATQNIMMAALSAVGETRIIHPAKEPEIEDLQNFINSCGGKITGAGTGEIVIHGEAQLHGCDYKVIPDRICAGTFLSAAAITGGEVTLLSAAPAQLAMTLGKLRQAGCMLRTEGDKIHIKGPKRLAALPQLKTLPYPGFPTDMQSQILTLLTVAEGESVITETIFENRFKQAEDLISMGADIRIEGNTARISGVPRLHGETVSAKDLRGGAALVLAGLAAEGKTIIENVCHIDRGYDRFEIALSQLGAKIKRIK